MAETKPRSVRVPADLQEWLDTEFPFGNFSELVVNLLQEFRKEWGDRQTPSDIIRLSIRRVVQEKH